MLPVRCRDCVLAGKIPPAAQHLAQSSGSHVMADSAVKAASRASPGGDCRRDGSRERGESGPMMGGAEDRRRLRHQHIGLYLRDGCISGSRFFPVAKILK